MKVKTIAPIVVGLIGAGMLLFSGYIAKQVAAGNLQIMQGQKQVDTVDSVFSSNRYTKPFGKQLAGSGQKKIDAGKEEIAKYELISKRLQIGGVILIVIGGASFFYWRKRS
jgi:hypothetical protein